MVLTPTPFACLFLGILPKWSGVLAGVHNYPKVESKVSKRATRKAQGPQRARQGVPNVTASCWKTFVCAWDPKKQEQHVCSRYPKKDLGNHGWSCSSRTSGRYNWNSAATRKTPTRDPMMDLHRADRAAQHQHFYFRYANGDYHQLSDAGSGSPQRGSMWEKGLRWGPEGVRHTPRLALNP